MCSIHLTSKEVRKQKKERKMALEHLRMTCKRLCLNGKVVLIDK